MSVKKRAPNKQRIRKWIEALRSGDYEQGRDNLYTEEGEFCCLGVACDLFVKDKAYAQKNRDSRAYGENLPRGAWYETLSEACGNPHFEEDLDQEWGPMIAADEDCDDGLPDKVADYLGIEATPHFVYQEEMLPVTVLNDRLRVPFKDLADLIEKKYLK